MCRQRNETMPLTAARQRQARAEAALAQGRTDFKPRTPRKRALEEMQNRTEDAEARARRATELLKQSLDEIEHQKKIIELWRARACELERLLLESKISISG